MPLARGQDGKLGVRASGGGGGGGQFSSTTVIHFHGDAGSKENQEQLARALPAIIDTRFAKLMSDANRSGGSLNPTHS
jgi:phage-related minor tail protein